jgi:hypothetical protein
MITVLKLAQQIQGAAAISAAKYSKSCISTWHAGNCMHAMCSVNFKMVDLLNPLATIQWKQRGAALDDQFKWFSSKEK